MDPCKHKSPGNTVNTILLKFRGTSEEDGDSIEEEIVIRRDTGDVTIRISIDNSRRADRHYITAKDVSTFMDRWSGKHFFEFFDDSPSQVPEGVEVTRRFELAVSFDDRSPIEVTGPYYREYLPDQWEDFVDSIYGLLASFRGMEVLDYDNYHRALCSDGEFMFCSVLFQPGGKSYYYISDDPGISVGDQVMVPVGEYDRTAAVMVEAIERYDEEDAPMEPEMVKHILRRCEEDERLDCFDQPLG